MPSRIFKSATSDKYFGFYKMSPNGYCLNAQVRMDNQWHEFTYEEIHVFNEHIHSHRQKVLVEKTALKNIVHNPDSPFCTCANKCIKESRPIAYYLNKPKFAVIKQHKEIAKKITAEVIEISDDEDVIVLD